jgi:hypothetical protein
MCSSEHQPYLEWIDDLSPSYPDLQRLMDWMIMTTEPFRNFGDPSDETWIELREIRRNRTTVMLIEPDVEIQSRQTFITKPGDLKSTLMALKRPGTKLFIVEDLSQQVIESLGFSFKIDPLFFREHIESFALAEFWYSKDSTNLNRSVWSKRLTSNLSALEKRRTWFSIRNVRLRLHLKNGYEDYEESLKRFNVMRWLDTHRNSDYLDMGRCGNMLVSITRTRTTIWIRTAHDHQSGTIGVVLVDPTVRPGFPFLQHRASWLPSPTYGTSTCQQWCYRTEGSWYKDICKMTMNYPWFEKPAANSTIDTGVIILPSLYTICAEWLLVCDYVKVRLVELEKILRLHSNSSKREWQLNRALESINIWRKELPTWKEMVDHTLNGYLVKNLARVTVTWSTSLQTFDAFRTYLKD